MKKRIVLLGATGSIGTQTLEILESFPDEFELIGISVFGNEAEVLEDILLRFAPKILHVFDRDTAGVFQQKYPNLCVLTEERGLQEISSHQEADIILNAIPGAAGVFPSRIALEQGKKLILANKESLVIAGTELVRIAQKTGARITPLDSELSAISQLLQEKDRTQIKKVYLTASGGPFRDASIWTSEKLKSVTASEALQHPTWKMGKKISIDSATLMNKAFEVIALVRLFDIPHEKIEVLVHPQSILHAALELNDGQVFAHMSLPDMKPTIWYSLFENEKPFPGIQSFNFLAHQLTFEAPDEERFPALQFARKALDLGESVCAAVCRKNDELVEKFLHNEITFLEIFSELALLLEKELSPVQNREKVDLLEEFLQKFQQFTPLSEKAVH